MKSNKTLKVIVALLAIIILASGLFWMINKDEDYGKKALESKVRMQFNNEGKFKIVIFSDLHSDIKKAPKYIKNIVDKENPDFVMITGDIEIFEGFPELEKYLDAAFGYLDDKKIPWAQVYGNHDVEYVAGGTSVKDMKEKVHAVYMKHPYNVSKPGPAGVSGESNYVLPVYGSDGKSVAMALWAIDSNMYLENNYKGMAADAILPNPINGGYKWDYIKPDQVMWYYNTSEALEKYAKKKIPGLMFFHIPLAEMNYIPNNPKETKMVGAKREPVNCSEINSGLFSFLLSRKDVFGIFNGHDHVNDFVGEYMGIRMAYTPCITHKNYHGKDSMGARVVIVDEKDVKKFETHIDYLLELGFYDDSLDRDDPIELTDEVLKKNNVEKHETANIPDKLNEPGMLANFDNFVSTQKDDLIAKGKGATVGTTFSSGTDIPPTQYPRVVSVPNGYKGNGVGIIKDEGTDYAVLSLYFPEKKYNGETYVRLYVDFTDVDWNMGSFGLIDNNGAVYQTRDNKGKEYMALFYLPDGETKWQNYTHSNQGRLGATQGTSLYNFKGWIALKVEDMLSATGPATNPQKERNGTHLKTGDVLKGLYIKYNLLHDSMIKKPFVFDEIAVTNEYWNFK
ncbi:MAG: metallophosphoesterase family protein [Synergistaceae bacterium]|nr:metallophosphoesterase family protein [Synergistaceae bacterium]